jgi:hypothetical protein
MKKGWIILVILSLMTLPMIASAQSMNFAVKLSGLDFQSAQFGLPSGSLMPFIGIDYFSLSGSGETEATDMMEATKIKAGISMFMPFIGARFYLSTTKPTKPYVYAGFFKAFPSVNAKVDGESMLDDETEKMIKDFLGFWGLKLGFGAEHKFNDWFGVGGEFGLRWMSSGGKVELTDYYIDAYDMFVDIKADVSAALKNTYAAFVLNFFF